MTPVKTLEQRLAERTTEGALYKKLPDYGVQCFACADRCRIPEGKTGVCKVRFNEEGVLRVPRDYATALEPDPMEKKPFFHVLPGAKAFSVGMLGCDYHCAYCQNWITSQALKNPAWEREGIVIKDVTAQAVAQAAVASGCKAVAATYNEPLITSEWALEIFKEARKANLLTAFISNGNATREALEYLRPWLDLYKVDLKCFNDKTYRRTMGGTLAPVLETIERAKAMGFWVEVVTLVVPGLNDGEKELADMARFIASVSRDIPWHVTAFHPDYQMMDTPWTTPEKLNLGWQAGKAAGLRYVYSGNLPGGVGATENTYCPSCGELLVERFGFKVLQDRLGEEGQCPHCQTSIPGVWKTPFRGPNKLIQVEKTPRAEEALMGEKGAARTAP